MHNKIHVCTTKYTLLGTTHKAVFPTAPISSPANYIKWSWLSPWQATKAWRAVEIYLYSFFKCGARLGRRWWMPSPSCWMPASKERDPVPTVQEAGSASGKENIALTSLRTPGCPGCGQPLYYVLPAATCNWLLSHSVPVDMVTRLHDKFQITSSLHSVYTTATSHSGKEQASQVLPTYRYVITDYMKCFTSAAHVQVRYNRLHEVLPTYRYVITDYMKCFTSAAHVQVRYNRLYEVLWQFFPIENRIIELISLWLLEQKFHLLLVPILL